MTLLALALSVAVAAAPPPSAVPFDFFNGMVFLKVGVNGSPPSWFILDSGASASVLDSGFAARLKVKTEGEQQGTGAGKGTVSVKLAKNIRYDVAGALHQVDTSYVIDLSGQLELQGREVAGILGHDFFARHVVDVDFESAVVTLHDPVSYRYAGPGESVPFVLKKKTPWVKMSVAVGGKEPRERELLVDLGSGDAVDDDLLKESPAKLEVVGGVGLGQEFRVVVGRADSARIGSFVLDRPVGATGGVQLIGTEVLRRFHVVFDYAHQRIILEPNGHLKDPFVVDASGIDLRWAAGLKELVVHDVNKGSPGAEAGLRAGDRLVAINGRASASFTIAQVSSLFRRAGATYHLGIRRGTEQMVLVLTCRTRL